MQLLSCGITIDMNWCGDKLYWRLLPFAQRLGLRLRLRV